MLVSAWNVIKIIQEILIQFLEMFDVIVSSTKYSLISRNLDVGTTSAYIKYFLRNCARISLIVINFEKFCHDFSEISNVHGMNYVLNFQRNMWL